MIESVLLRRTVLEVRFYSSAEPEGRRLSRRPPGGVRHSRQPAGAHFMPLKTVKGLHHDIRTHAPPQVPVLTMPAPRREDSERLKLRKDTIVTKLFATVVVNYPLVESRDPC